MNGLNSALVFMDKLLPYEANEGLIVSVYAHETKNTPNNKNQMMIL